VTLERPTISWTDDRAAAASQMTAMTTVDRDFVMRDRSGNWTTCKLHNPNSFKYNQGSTYANGGVEDNLRGLGTKVSPAWSRDRYPVGSLQLCPPEVDEFCVLEVEFKRCIYVNLEIGISLVMLLLHFATYTWLFICNKI